MGNPRTIISNRTVVPSNNSVSLSLILNFGGWGKTEPPGVVGLESGFNESKTNMGIRECDWNDWLEIEMTK